MKRIVLGLLCFGCCVWANDDSQKLKSSVVDENKSFSENLKNIQIPDSLKLQDIVIGKEDAPHTLVIYSSFTCNHCLKFHKEDFPILKTNYIDTGKVKVILRNYIDDLGALEAAILMRIYYEKSKDALKLYKILFDAQKEWMKSPKPREFLKKIFVKAGYDDKEVGQYLDSNNADYKRISAGLMKEQQRAMHTLNIASVPAFVFNNSNKAHQGILSWSEIVDKLTKPEAQKPEEKTDQKKQKKRVVRKTKQAKNDQKQLEEKTGTVRKQIKQFKMSMK